jgi:hypothetical protein
MNRATFTLNPIVKDVIDISAGSGVTLYIDSNHHLLSSGTAYLNGGKERKDRLVPQPVEGSYQILFNRLNVWKRLISFRYQQALRVVPAQRKMERSILGEMVTVINLDLETL